MDMLEHHLGYRETVRKHWKVTRDLDLDLNYINILKKWERIYLEERAEGLMKERRDRASLATATRKGRQEKLDKKVEEDLIAENQRLRMEIEYLKKLRALVLMEEQKNNKKLE